MLAPWLNTFKLFVQARNRRSVTSSSAKASGFCERHDSNRFKPVREAFEMLCKGSFEPGSMLGGYGVIDLVDVSEIAPTEVSALTPPRRISL